MAEREIHQNENMESEDNEKINYFKNSDKENGLTNKIKKTNDSVNEVKWWKDYREIKSVLMKSLKK